MEVEGLGVLGKFKDLGLGILGCRDSRVFRESKLRAFKLFQGLGRGPQKHPNKNHKIASRS